MIEIGSLDQVTSIIGERKTGKSTLAVMEAREFQRWSGGFVVGHSPNGQIGAAPDISFHTGLRALEKGIRRHTDRIHVVTDGASPEDVFEYGISLARALRRRAIERAGHKFRDNRPAPPGTYAAPVLILIDEGTHLDHRARKHSDSLADIQKKLTSARHLHIASTILTQEPNARAYVWQSQSNRFRVFRYMHEWGLNSVRAAGLPKEHLERIKTLPNFHYFHFDKEDPQGASFRVLPKP